MAIVKDVTDEVEENSIETPKDFNFIIERIYFRWNSKWYHFVYYWFYNIWQKYVKKSYKWVECCEEYGHPNVTNKGTLLYDNTSFRTREEAEEFLIKESILCLKYGLENLKDDVKELEKRIDFYKRSVDCLFKYYLKREK